MGGRLAFPFPGAPPRRPLTGLAAGTDRARWLVATQGRRSAGLLVRALWWHIARSIGAKRELPRLDRLDVDGLAPDVDRRHGDFGGADDLEHATGERQRLVDRR